MVFETSLPRVKAFTTKSAKLSSGLSSHGGKRKQSFKLLSALHTYTVPARMSIHAHIINKMFLKETF